MTRDCVISADEKTSIQARQLRHPIEPPNPGNVMKVEAEYVRKGALAYLAAWDVRNARLFGLCEKTTGIVPFSRLVHQVMSVEPYASADRVFWILDNASYHRGQSCVERLVAEWPNIVPIHLPIHASWLNQIEIYFSILQRKAITPSNSASLLELEEQILGFQAIYQQTAKPFEWRFTRKDLKALMNRISAREKLVA